MNGLSSFRFTSQKPRESERLTCKDGETRALVQYETMERRAWSRKRVTGMNRIIRIRWGDHALPALKERMKAGQTHTGFDSPLKAAAREKTFQAPHHSLKRGINEGGANPISSAFQGFFHSLPNLPPNGQRITMHFFCLRVAYIPPSLRQGQASVKKTRWPFRLIPRPR